MKHTLDDHGGAVPVDVRVSNRRAVAAALALLLLVLVAATVAQASERLWTVTCGLPQQDNLIRDLFGEYTVPLPGGSSSGDGHMEMKMLHRPHPERGISTEMWILSRNIGWWMLKAMWVHPDDVSKVSIESIGDATDIRQIIDSPFLSQRVVVRGTDNEDLVNKQILALMPDAARLQCAPQSER
ncbi:MAG: hypothetical protein OXH88_07330 [Gammaproteobacteria bacterium]|nr:hypothetical protein [Gammaproteobacteria bacterium]